MSDARRYRVFADFIGRTFPDAQRIADIAGGHGDLAFWLYELGKQTVTIDPRGTTFSRRRIHRALRKQAIRTGKVIYFERRQLSVEEADLSGFDLVAALHPDQATEPTLKTALTCGIDFAIVPCCVFPMDGVKRSQEEWLSYLASLAPDIRRSELPITGANVVLWRRSQVEGRSIGPAALSKRERGSGG